MIAFVVAQLVWLKKIKMFYLIIHLHIFTSRNASKRNVVSNQLLHVCIKLDYKGHRTQQCYILFVVSLIFRWLLWLPSMHKSALLTLVALDGDGLESYGCIVWFSTFPWTLSNSQFAIAWVEMPGIYCLIERYCNVLSCIVLLYYQSKSLWGLALESNDYSWFLFTFDSQQTAFTSKKDYGKEDRAAKWVLSQRSLQGLHDLEFKASSSSTGNSTWIAEQARRRAEIAR